MENKIPLQFDRINDGNNARVGGNIGQLVNLAGGTPPDDNHHLSHSCPDGIDRDDIVTGRLRFRTDQIDQKKFKTFKPVCFSGGHDGPFDPTEFHESRSDEV